MAANEYFNSLVNNKIIRVIGLLVLGLAANCAVCRPTNGVPSVISYWTKAG